MELTREEALRRLCHHRLLWFILASTTSLMLIVFAEKATVDFIVESSSSPVALVRFAKALVQLRELPVISALWIVAPLELEQAAGFLFAPCAAVMVVLFASCSCLTERVSNEQLAKVLAHIRIVSGADHGACNCVGDVYANVGVHIPHTFRGKPSARPVLRAVLVAVGFLVAGGLAKVFTTWMEI
jgi:hypothetical protein